MSKIRYIVWDAGGTLFDTYPAVVDAFLEALATLGVTESAKNQPSAEWVMSLCRQTTSHCIETLAETYELAPETLESRFRAIYRARDGSQQPPFPGVEAICRYMVRLGGQNFVVTHRARASLRKLLTVHELAHYFTECVTKEDPYPRKPDPAAICALLARHGLEVAHGLAIGDRDLDIQAARNAGLCTCHFGQDPHPTPADLEIEDYAVLLQWLRWKNGDSPHP